MLTPVYLFLEKWKLRGLYFISANRTGPIGDASFCRKWAGRRSDLGNHRFLPLPGRFHKDCPAISRVCAGNLVDCRLWQDPGAGRLRALSEEPASPMAGRMARR
ncbi:MAG TPA: hypothetical protein DDZ83_00400 [Nitrospinae bacterium]|nr:hypothetical protein [Nitrospinota bacterium]